jgi:hypothetical protein
MIVIVLNAQREGGFKFCWDTKNNGALPLDLAFTTESLNVRSPAGLP